VELALKMVFTVTVHQKANEASEKEAIPKRSYTEVREDSRADPRQAKEAAFVERSRLEEEEEERCVFSEDRKRRRPKVGERGSGGTSVLIQSRQEGREQVEAGKKRGRLRFAREMRHAEGWGKRTWPSGRVTP